MQINYDPLPVPADCSVSTIQWALKQIGEDAKHVSSDVYVSNRWSVDDVRGLQTALEEQGSLANRVRIDPNLRPYEWYVECCGSRVGCNPTS